MSRALRAWTSSVCLVIVTTCAFFMVTVAAASSISTYEYSAGRAKANKNDMSIKSTAGHNNVNSFSSRDHSSASTYHPYVEPRGDYNGGSGYAAAPAVYQYHVQPYGGGGGGGGWGPQPHAVYYEDEGLDKGLLGLIGLGGLGGLKGLIGLAALAKLLLPLLALFIPLLLPLLLAKALLLLALLLLIPVPVVTTGKSLGNLGEASPKSLIQDTLSELASKLPVDMNQIISKIKDSEIFKWKAGKEKKARKMKSDSNSDNVVNTGTKTKSSVS